MAKLRVSAGVVAAATLAVVSLAGPVRAADDWTFPVANVVDGKEVPATYTPIPVGQVTKRWKICVLFPHMKDSYWLAANYGVVAEHQFRRIVAGRGLGACGPSVSRACAVPRDGGRA